MTKRNIKNFKLFELFPFSSVFLLASRPAASKRVHGRGRGRGREVLKKWTRDTDADAKILNFHLKKSRPSRVQPRPVASMDADAGADARF